MSRSTRSALVYLTLMIMSCAPAPRQTILIEQPVGQRISVRKVGLIPYEFEATRGRYKVILNLDKEYVTGHQLGTTPVHLYGWLEAAYPTAITKFLKVRITISEEMVRQILEEHVVRTLTVTDPQSGGVWLARLTLGEKKPW